MQGVGEGARQAVVVLRSKIVLFAMFSMMSDFELK